MKIQRHEAAPLLYRVLNDLYDRDNWIDTFLLMLRKCEEYDIIQLVICHEMALILGWLFCINDPLALSIICR